MSRPPAKCGTDSGYMRHRRYGERPCLACCDAHALAEDDRAKAPQRRAVLEEAISRRGSAGHSLEADGGPPYGDRREAILEGGAA